MELATPAGGTVQSVHDRNLGAYFHKSEKEE